MKTLNTAAAWGALAFTLAACQSVSLPVRPVAVAPPQQAPVEGRWVSGRFAAEFDGGRFRSTTLAGDRVLAEGRYTRTGPQSVRISWYSQRLQQQQTANCTYIDDTVLDCTQDSGEVFRMARAAVG